MNECSHDLLALNEGKEVEPIPTASPPGRIWAIGVLVLSALVSMSMNTWHAWNATSLPKPLAVLYGVAPVALAAMQSHAVALRALRKEEVGAFRKGLTFALVLGGLGLSFLGIYDLLRHAVPDPIPAVPLHEPAVFFSIVLDVMALAALHELLRESPAFASAALATVPAVPAPVAVSPTVEGERATETPAITSASPEVMAPEAPSAPAVPDPIEGVPAQVSHQVAISNSVPAVAAADPLFSHQERPGTESVYDDPLRGEALKQYLPDLLQGGLPTVRTIKDQMSVGTDRARGLQAYLGRLVEASQ
ncbi:hypothetical protein [Nonomuraea typhae]|uniref:hypothetical protein n=1 Tax=Nonomuraea typhae TaxID=2603600 RepID=UPI0012F859E2|nr:hypothetical protein [Nonomuraea typhae]